ncbi:hypothetical protein YC2023_055047 [Brassica napus]
MDMFQVKALHHEVTCKNALLKAKCSEQEVWFLAFIVTSTAHNVEAGKEKPEKNVFDLIVI